MTSELALELRPASAEDAERLLEIYAPYVTDTAVTAENVVPSLREFEERIRKIGADYPWLVCLANGKIAGYAYACRHREREAYKWSVDVAAYVDPTFHRIGVASHLYNRLLFLLTEQGFYNAFAGISMSNSASIRLHEKVGFSLVGVYQSVAFKLGAWHDVGWWQKPLQPNYAPPRN
ncbi:MAG: N-acetyltransferase family protein [Oligoflexales bacterium]